MVVTLDEARRYLRVDTTDEDATISTLLQAAQQLCMDVARISDESEFAAAGDVARIAVLYALANLFEAREDADTHDLTLKLRALLFGVRKETP